MWSTANVDLCALGMAATTTEAYIARGAMKGGQLKKAEMTTERAGVSFSQTWRATGQTGIAAFPIGDQQVVCVTEAQPRAER